MSDNKDDKLGLEILSEDEQEAKGREPDPVAKKVKADSDPLTAGVENFYDFTVEDLPPGSDDLYRPKAKQQPKVDEPLSVEPEERIDIAKIQGFGKHDNHRQNPSAQPAQNTGAQKSDDMDMEFVEMPSMNPDMDDLKPSTTQRQEAPQPEQNDKAAGAADDGVKLPARLDVPQGPQGGAGGAITRRRAEIREMTEESQGQGDADGKTRLGDRLVQLGIITTDQLNVAIQEKKITGRMLGEVLVDLGFIDEETLTALLAETSGFDVFDPKSTIVDGDALALLDKNVAKKHNILPLSITDTHVHVAMSDPYDVLAMDTIRRYIPKGKQIKPVVTTATVISEAIDAAYGYSSSISGILKELEEGEVADVTTLDESEAFTHPIVRLVNALVFDAVKLGVSDLHFEPEENFIRLRYRLDGVLYTAQILHRQHWSGISQRIKLMSQMNIADKLSPQDGRFGMNVGGREADFRVSSLPTVHGENIVLRVLDKSSSIMPLRNLGFSEENMKKIERSQQRPEGIIIVTGPTGSGKSTSLYSMLNAINNVEVNIQTLEDPVEYSLPMIRQTNVREGVLDFADGIKALLRQDPDIIFIGEIRDKTTAEMALKAAMTGHQVYTTLHTNDSFGAIPRLLDLGLKPGMIAGALIAVFAQRLVRRLCEHCKEPHRPSADECRVLAVNSSNPPTVYKAHQGGCDMCAGQGYKGRVAIAEILTFDEEMDELLARGESKADLKMLAEKKGFKSLKDDGILKVLDGLTSLEALSKVVDINK